jgi:hypothetical protein
MNDAFQKPAPVDGASKTPTQRAEVAQGSPLPLTAGSLAVSLLIFQILGVPIAVAIATIEIESIVGTGPIFSLTGVAAAVVAWRYARWPRLLFGFSAPAISVICFLAIFLQHWSPGDAARPISVWLILYELLLLPVGLLGLYQTVLQLLMIVPRRSRQFSLRALLAVVFATSVALAAARIAFSCGQNVRTIAAVAVCVAAFVAVAICLTIGLRTRRRSGYDSGAAVSGISDTMLDSFDRQSEGCEL